MKWNRRNGWRSLALLAVLWLSAFWLFLVFSPNERQCKAEDLRLGEHGTSGSWALSPYELGQVSHFRLVGSLNTSDDSGRMEGVLHLFLKALVYPDDTTRLRGVAWFEPAVFPQRWLDTAPGSGLQLYNAPELWSTLRLVVRSRSLRRERQVRLSFAPCPGLTSHEPGGGTRCLPPGPHVISGERKQQPPLPSRVSLGELRVNFGATVAPDWELAVDGWQAHVDVAWVLSHAARAVWPLDGDGGTGIGAEDDATRDGSATASGAPGQATVRGRRDEEEAEGASTEPTDPGQADSGGGDGSGGGGGGEGGGAAGSREPGSPAASAAAGLGAAKPPSAPAVWRVIKPTVTSDPQIPAVLARVLEYDALAGLDGTILYLRDRHLGRLESSPELLPHLRSGRLRLVRWGSTVPTVDGWETYDQPTVNNHAILSAWGAGSLLWLADLDELLALPTPGLRLGDLLAEGGCLRPASQCARLRGVPAFSEAVDEPGVDGADGAPAAVRGTPSAANRLVQVAAAATLRQALGPFVLLDHSASWSKTLVDPGASVGFAVHTGYSARGKDEPSVLDDAGEGRSFDLVNGPEPLDSRGQVIEPCSNVPKSCIFFLHLLNLHRNRVRPANTTARDDTWTWALPPASSP